MSKLSFHGLSKSFGCTAALRDVTLEVAQGEFVSLLGGSGCGKTTLLRILAGFTRADAGEVRIDGQRVDHLPPGQRGLGFVFQSYALFPTQTVAQNIGFALPQRGLDRAGIARRVAELCEMMQLAGLERRYPHELSGGQQQRVALARALAPNPGIMLMDEPLSALDARIRAHLRGELRGIVERLGVTTIYVTHDQEEALELSDRIAVMEAGRIRQVGTATEVYLRPADRQVADFIGKTNVFAGLEGTPGGAVLCVRPEHVEVVPPAARGPAHPYAARLAAVAFTGQVVRLRLDAGLPHPVLADVWAGDWLALGLQRGDAVAWGIRPGCALAFPRADGEG